MAHRIDMGAWKQHCDERIKKLKHDEAVKKSKAKEIPILAEQEKCQGAKEILVPELCEAIKGKKVEPFVSKLETLCKEGPCVSEIMDQATRSGNTVLHLATHAKSRKIVELIAGHYPKLLKRRSIKGDTVLHVAARIQKSKLIKTILDCHAKHPSTDGEELCKMKDKYGNTALHYAVVTGDLDGVSDLFDADEEVVHYLNKEGKSPLYLAVESGKIDIIEVLLRASFENVVWHQGKSPLHAAILGANSVAANEFCSEREQYVLQTPQAICLSAEVPEKQSIPTDILTASVYEAASPLPTEQFDLNIHGSPSRTEATASPHYQLSPPLKSSTPSIPSTVGPEHHPSPFEEIASPRCSPPPALTSPSPSIPGIVHPQHGLSPIKATAIPHYPSSSPSTSPTPSIPNIVGSQHRTSPIKGGDTFGVCDPIGVICVQSKRLLASGIKEPKAELVEHLLMIKPELIPLRDQKGDSPLHWAASIGHLNCVEILLREDRLSTLEWNTKGHLPVHVACKRGHVEVVKKIAKQEWLDPKDLLNKKGQNMLHIAAKNGKDKVVSYILRHKKRFGELLDERDEDGNTPLHLASKYLHPKVLLLFTKEGTADVNLVNNEGLTARDIVLLQREVPRTFRELLVSAILRSAGATFSEKAKQIEKQQNTQPPQMNWLKDRINTLMLVATLVATVSFAAGFTVPGGYNSSDDSDSNRRGMATLLNRKMFQLYTICDVVAMYSSTVGSFILLWAQLGDFYLASGVMFLALGLVGLALFTMSIAFMAAVHLVVSNLSWLANAVMIISIIFLLVFLVAFVLLIYPIGTQNIFLRQISYLVLRMMIPFSGSSRKLIGKKNKVQGEQSERDKDKDAPPQKESIDKPEKQRTS